MENLMTIERFQNVVKMLESPDNENRILALSILEEQDFVGNLAFILLCKKHGHAGNEMWKENAPITFQKMSEIPGLDIEKQFTYKLILEALTKTKAPIPQIQFYLDEFSRYLLKQIQNLGYYFVEDVEMKLKIKDHDQIGEFSKGN